MNTKPRYGTFTSFCFFLSLASCLMAAVVHIKYYKDPAWWELTLYKKCMYHYNNISINKTIVTSELLPSACIPLEQIQNRCNHNISKCETNSSVYGNRTYLAVTNSEDMLRFIFIFNTVSYSVIGAVLLLVTTLQIGFSFNKLLNETDHFQEYHFQPAKSSRMIEQPVKSPRIIERVFSLLCGMLHFSVLVLTGLICFFTYSIHGTLLTNNLFTFLNITVIGVTSIIVIYYFSFMISAAVYKNGDHSSNWDCCKTCIGLCISVTVSKLLCTLIGLGILVGLGYLGYRYLTGFDMNKLWPMS